MVPAGLGISNPDDAAIEAEQERALAALIKFKKFDPPIFEGGKVELSVVESWIDSMETLFENLYTSEKDKFKRAMFANYFPDTVKQKLQEKFHKLRQGDRSVADCEQEFSHIIDCVPDIVRDDRDRADWFLRGLRPRIYEAVQILKITTFAKVFDRALWAEHGNTYAREECEAMAEARDKGKKRAVGGAGGRPNAKKPPRYPRQQARSWKPSRCTIYGGDHRPPACPQRGEKCYKCGQAGHMARECPSWGSSASTAA
ncbi:uncharacterized protein LOC109719279 [Ananas comosus]|uniref:Uncharacterized protein LOC109719279 n=1 Tax=Ananas comosus TaxID=4615 RepID=A0A6P5G0S9_ANACO|nr:uncharacterized protein LOC109719279 [Ananas comosus]